MNYSIIAISVQHVGLLCNYWAHILNSSHSGYFSISVEQDRILLYFSDLFNYRDLTISMS